MVTYTEVTRVREKQEGEKDRVVCLPMALSGKKGGMLRNEEDDVPRVGCKKHVCK